MRSILFVCLLSLSLATFSQKVTYTGIILVDSFPEEMLPPGTSEVGFVTANDNNQPVGFGYELSELNYKIIAKFGKEFDGFAGVEAKAYYSQDTVFFWSHVKYKDVQTVVYYSWDGEKLKYLGSETTDPSKEASEKGEAALRNKEVREAATEYNKVKYVSASQEAKTAYTLLNVANYLAMDALFAASYQEAVEYLDGAFTYHLNKRLIEAEDEFAFHKITMEYFDQKQIDSLGPWMTHYALCLYKADSLDKCEQVCRIITLSYPKMTDPFLIRADALWDLGRTEEAQPIYDKYVGLMMSRGDEALIPERAKERHKEK